MKTLRALLYAVLLFTALAPANAQFAVSVAIKRRLFILHEPVLATVTLTNMTGRDVTLADTAEFQWFGFQITGANETNIPPRNAHYSVEPIQLRPGETVKRTVNLNELYQLGEFGLLRVRAAIHFADTGKYHVSKPEIIEMTEGTKRWQQTVGVPGSTETRTFTLLSHQQEVKRMLYIRCEDPDSGIVYCTFPVGGMIEGISPQAAFDAVNCLYVLQLTGQRAYVLTKVGLNGQFMGQTHYAAPKTRPTLRKLADGKLQIIGGVKQDPVVASAAPTEPPLRLSDRPPGLPK